MLSLQDSVSQFLAKQKAEREQKLSDCFSRILNKDEHFGFKSIECTFGKVWCSKGSVQIKIISTGTCDTNIKKAINAHFAQAKYLVPEDVSHITKIIKPLLADLLQAKKYGLTKTFWLNFENVDGKLYMFLTPKIYIPKKQDKDTEAFVSFPSNQTNVTFTGVNTEASSFYETPRR